MTSKLFASAAVLALMAGAGFAQDLKFPVGEGAFNWDSYKAFDEATNLDGQTLTIFGPWRGEDQALVESMLAYFTAASGVTVKYSSSENYEQQIVIDTQAGSPPDIAVLPQPGLIADLNAQRSGDVEPAVGVHAHRMGFHREREAVWIFKKAKMLRVLKQRQLFAELDTIDFFPAV